MGVDDLVIVKPSSRRHVQIKSGQEPSWESRLVDAVWSDYFTYHADIDRSLTLQICVGSQEAETRMVKNLPSHHLEHTGVEVFHEELKNLNEPFRDERIRKLMLSMSHVPDHELLLPTMWSDISGAWRKVGRNAEIVDIFACIDHFSRQTTKSIHRPTELQKALAAQLSDNIEELYFLADSDKLVVTDLYGETILPVVRGYDWGTVLTRFTGELPKTLDEFEGAVGSRKRRTWKGE